MKFDEIDIIHVDKFENKLDKKEIREIKRVAKENGYGLDFDVEIGSDGYNGLTYVTLNINFIDDSKKDVYVESHEVLAVEDIPKDRNNEVDLIETSFQVIGQKLIK